MSTRVFAVDLGAWSIKLAMASPGIRGATLLGVHERRIDPPAFEGEPLDVRMRKALSSLLDELRVKDDNGYIGVYGDQVFTQVLEFGFKNLRRGELEKAVGNELEGVVPVDLEDMVYTFEPLPPAPALGPMTPEGTRGRIAPPADGMRVLTYAMRRDRAEQMIEIGRTAGFEPRGLLAAGGAAIRLVERTPSLASARETGAIAVIDIGHERTDVVIVAHGKAVFSRSFARAGKQITEAIARQWPHLSWEQAEQAKHTDGFVASQAHPAQSDAWAKIHQALIGELTPFARDLRQTLAACRAKTGFTATTALVVGGGARLNGIAPFLSEQLGITVARPNADDLVALAGPRLGADAAMLPIDSAAMTLGMVFDAAGGRPLFDLRSGVLSMKMDLSFLRAKAVPLGAAALAIAAFAAGSAYADLYRLRKAEKVLKTRLATESAEVFDGKPKSADEILNQTKGGTTTKASPMPKMTAYDVLLEISQKMPPKDKVTLDIDKLEIKDQKLDMTGTVKTPEEIDLVVKALEDITCFSDITRGATTTKKVGDADFREFKLTITSKCM